MSYFDIHLNYMRQAENELERVKSDLRRIRQQIQSVERELSRCMSRKYSVSSSVKKMMDTLRRQENSLESLKTSLEAIVNAYRATENNIRRGAISPTAKNKQQKIPTYQKLLNGIKNAFNKGKSAAKTIFGGDPVNLATGNFIYGSEDIPFGNEEGFFFHRFYNSAGTGDGALGRDWIHNFECSLVISQEQEHVMARVLLDDGQEIRFIQGENSIWYALDPTNAVLKQNETGFLYIGGNQNRLCFDQDGRFVRMESLNGLGYSLQYDSNKKLVRVSHDNGDFITFDYDEAGYLSTATASDGRTYGFFVSDGLLLRAVEPDQSAWTYGYTDSGLLEAVRDPEGQLTVQNEYDDLGRTIGQTFADGSAISYFYDDDEMAVSVTERNGSEVTYYHDADGAVYRVVYPDSEWNCEFDDRGNKIRVLDRNGNEWRYSYDQWGNVSSVIDPVGTKTVFTYGAHRRPLQIKTNGTVTMKNSFDNNGNIISSEDALGRRLQFVYGNGRDLRCVILQDGTELSVGYDDLGRINSISMPTGGNIFYQYDEQGRVISFTDPSGNTTGLTYDIVGRILTETNAEGGVRQYDYDRNGNVTKITDPDGSCSTRTYNALNLPESMTDAAGRTTKYSYDSMWNLTQICTPANAVFSYVYDENNRLSATKDAEGGEQHFEYDGNGNRLAETDEEGNTVRYEYDKMDRLIHVCGDNSEIKFVYDAFGNMISAEDALGNRVNIEYDAAGQRVKESDSSGQILLYTYDVFGNISSVTDEDGRKQSFTYTKGGEYLEKVQYPEGIEEKFEYDLNGNLIRHKDAVGQIEEFRYDVMNRVTQAIRKGVVFNYTYDPLGNVICVEDSRGGKTNYTYTVTGMLSSVEDAVGNKIQYFYDEDDRLVHMKQEGNPEEPPRITSYSRDRMGRTLLLTDPAGNEERYTYNLRGDLVSVLDKDGLLTKYEYTAAGNICHIQFADGRDVFYSYDALARLCAINDWNGMTILERDPAGSTLKVTYPDQREASYCYNPWGALSSAVYPDGQKRTYEYDEQHRLHRILADDQEFLYHYDHLGRIVQKDLPGGLCYRLTYNEEGLPASFVSTDQEGELDRFETAYDVFGCKTNLRSVRRGLPQFSGSYTMTYDMVHRLTSVSRDGNLLREYAYDAYGNRISKIDYANGNSVKTSYAYNALDELTAVQEKNISLQFDYDRRGNLSRICQNGILLHKYNYDVSGRLSAVAGSDGRHAEYDYDGLGQRIGRRIFHNGTRIHSTKYLRDLTREYDNLILSEEQNAEDEICMRQSFFYDNGPLAMRENGRNGSSATYSFLNDDLGSPARLMTADGNVAESYAYDEFGLDLIGDGEKQPFGYTGYMRDEVAGSYFAQAREYLPLAGRFAAHDLVPAWPEEPQTQNGYIYANNNPYTFVDKNGKFAISAALFTVAIGAAFGAASGAAINGIGQAIEIHRDPTGNTKWSWSKFWADTAGGAVTGGISVIPGGKVVQAIAGIGSVVAGGAVTDIINDVHDKGHIDWAHVGEDAFVNTAFGVASWGVGKVLEPLKKKISGSTVGKWVKNTQKHIRKKILGSSWSESTIRKQISTRSKHGQHIKKLWERLINISAAKSFKSVLQKSFYKWIGYKKPKDILKDMAKSWLPWYKDPDKDKSLVDYLEDYWDGLIVNPNRFCRARAAALSD